MILFVNTVIAKLILMMDKIAKIDHTCSTYVAM